MMRKVTSKNIATLPQVKREVWEIGRRALDVAVSELQQQGARPEILLAVQPQQAEAVVLFDFVPSSAPPTVLADFALRAMAAPLLGTPRRPQALRVASQTDAEILAETLSGIGVWLDVSSALPSLDAVHRQMGSMLGGLVGDYRAQAAQAGDVLSEDGLREFFRVARRFYGEELWLDFGDEALFEIERQASDGASKTCYGILMGNAGEEFGLVLYDTLQDLRQFYELTEEHADRLMQFPEEAGAARMDAKQRREESEVTSELLSVPSLALTYTRQQDVPPTLVEEARGLKLPFARKTAFPLVMRTGQGRLQVGAAHDLRQMYTALKAILDWDRRIWDMGVGNEADVTLTSHLPAVANFLPETTVRTTLRRNPCVPEDVEPTFPEALDHDFLALLQPQPTRTPPAKPKSTKKKLAARPTAAATSRKYTLRVYLTGGPLTEAYEGQEISRTIQILGQQTLHDLHRAIFQAFDRFEEHLYEFNLGKGPADRTRLYEYGEYEDGGTGGGNNPETTTLDALRLRVGRRFGYTFDMGDNWEHVIEVTARDEGPVKGKFPRITGRVGASPPQYPDGDEDE